MRICCLDGYRETNLGNVFEDGLYNVWNGEEFQRIRGIHEAGEYEKYKFCQTCEQWAGFKITKEKNNRLKEKKLKIKKKGDLKNLKRKIKYNNI